MSQVLENRIAHAIGHALIGRPQRHSNTGWTNINCPMCTLLGHPRADRLKRCGVMLNPDVVVFCFNCKFKTGYRVGWPLHDKTRRFLEQLGIPDREVKILGLWAEQMRRKVTDSPVLQQQLQILPQFDATNLPDDAQPLQQWDCNDRDYLDTVNYLLSRGDTAATATTYYWSPQPLLRRRLIIPCYQHHRVVGWLARSIDPHVKQRYYRQAPSQLLFNIDLLQAPQRAYVFIVEGAFDALCIEGVAALGGTLNAQQVAWIKQSDKQIVVVPDRDKAGMGLVNLAIEHGWAVAFPCYGRHQWWDHDVKDAAAAVQRYGQLFTLQSIIATMTSDPRHIRLRSRYFA